MKKKSLPILALLVVGVGVGAGTLTGLSAARLFVKTGGASLISGPKTPIAKVAGDNAKNGDIYGESNTDNFKDTAEGYLEIGGIDGEGSHKLSRAGGISQTVYLTTSATDLDKFEGMQVKVWGDTFKAQKAGWLMDVGRVQIVNTQGAAPTAN